MSVKAKKRTARPAAKKSRTARKPPAAKPAAAAIPAKGAILAVLPKVTRAHFTANSAAVLLARLAKKTLTLFDIASASETPPLAALPAFSAVALSTDSRFIALGTTTGILAVQSSQSGKILWKTKKAARTDALPITEITFTHDGALVIAARAGWLQILDAKTGQPPAGLDFDPIPGAACPHLALSPDGLFLAHSETHSNSALVWHIPTRTVAHFIKLPIPHGPVVRLAFGITVRQLFIAQAKSISTWNGETGQQVLQFDITPGAASMAVLDHANVLATVRPAGDAPALDLWSAPTGRLRRTLNLPPANYGPLAASPDGSTLALMNERECYLWNSARLIP